MRRIKIIVHGSVQGVFFRYSAKKEAKKLNLTGWCCNDSDGTVSIEAQGEEEKINKFITWVHKGPPLAHVNELAISKIDLENEEEDFEIR